MKKSEICFILIFTFFTLVVYPGYSVFGGDHNIYIPQLYKSINPELYPNDTLFEFSQTSLTHFGDLTIILINITGLDIFYIFIILAFVTRLVYFYAVYKISYYLTNDRKFSLLSSSLLIGGLAIYGTITTTFDIIVQPRPIALSLCLLFVVLFWENKRLVSIIPLSLSIFMHPMIALPFLVFFYLSLFIEILAKRRLSINLIVSGLIPFLSGILFLARIKGNADLSLFGVISKEWEAIIRFRNPSFILDWSYTSFVYLIISLILFTIAYYGLNRIFTNKEKKNTLLILILTSLGLFVLSFITVDLAKLQLFQQFQLSRGLIIPKILITILFAYYTYIQVRENQKNLLQNMAFIGIIVSILIKEIMLIIFLPALILIEIKRYKLKNINFPKNKLFIWFTLLIPPIALLIFLLTTGMKDRINYLIAIIAFTTIISIIVYKFGLRINLKYISLVLLIITILFISQFTIYPKYYKDKEFIEACNWIKTNTSKSDMFLVQPFSNMSGQIRIECLRPVFTSGKEGGQAAFNEEYAKEWKKRFDKILELEKNKYLIYKLSEEYNLSYIFSDSNKDLNYSLQFNNTKYFIYKTS